MIPFKAHPVIAAPSQEQVLALVRQHGAAAPALLQKIEKDRLDLMAKMDRDRFGHGYVIPQWKAAEALLGDCTMLAVFGGNGAAKTVFSIWLAIKMMVENPGFKVLFLHEAEQASINVHQKFSYDYLPVNWKPTDSFKVKKGLTTKINYSLADGFTNNKFVLPNGSIAQFAFYGQDVGDYEGGGWNLIVADENLPLGWLKTLLFRLPRVGGKFIWTFTPIKGITPAVKHVVDGARTVEHRRAELLTESHRVSDAQDWPAGHMPTVQESVLPGVKILYFFPEDNPFSGYEQMKALAPTISTLDIERRFYGYARNTVRAMFPLFGKVNILPPAKIPDLSALTCYHVLDPAGRRNFFQIWLGVDEQGRHFVYREWPDVETLGEWAVPSEDKKKWDGEEGPAQPTLGYGVIEYKRLILTLEGNRLESDGWVMEGEEVFERKIDPRSGKAQSVAEDDGEKSLIDRFAEEQLDNDGRIVGPSMEFVPASGVREEEGITAINDRLSYNPLQPVTPFINEPRLFVSEKCINLIWALQNYTGHDGEKAACKDPVDVLRYAEVGDLEYIPPGSGQGLSGGSY
tara:strand:- start:3206 stop:4921 length:1716 start_codon:yes stop_codon:yes gene_type:complete